MSTAPAGSIVAAEEATAPSPTPAGAGVDLGPLRAALRERSTARPRGSWLGLLLTMGLFALTSGEARWEGVVALIGVILFHELGHVVAMVASGYRDARIFFIPFMGAVAIGSPSRPSPVKEVLVSLAGPVPGLVLAIGLVVAGARSWPEGENLVNLLVGLNALNLIPVLPLDGGRVVGVAVSGRPVLATLFAMFSGLALIPLGLAGGTVTTGIAVVFILGLWSGEAQRRRATRLRAERTWTPDLLEATDEELGRLRAALPARERAPHVEAEAIAGLHARVVEPRPSIGVALLALVGYVLTLGVLAVGLVLSFLVAPDRLTAYQSEAGGYELALPGAPGVDEDGQVVAVYEDGFFAAVFRGPPGSAADPDAYEAELARTVPLLEKLPTEVERSSSEHQGRPARRIRRAGPDGTEVRTLVLDDGTTAVVVMVRSDGRYAVTASRVLASFRLTGPGQP